MADKVICRYCPGGVEMELGYTLDAIANEHSLSGISYMRYVQCQCPVCKSTSPRAITPETALMLARRHVAPPNRVLTLEEVKAHIAESNDVPSLYAEFNCRDDEFVVHWRSGDSLCQLMKNSGYNYGKTWRCWLRKPTNEERQATLWDCST